MKTDTRAGMLSLSREVLKCLAMLFMLFDHAYMTVVHTQGFAWMTAVGRLAFPIFAFQLAEGYHKTTNRKAYAGKLVLFALVSEIPFNFMMSGSWFDPFSQNVMFTFVIAMGFMELMRRILHSQRLPRAVQWLLCLLLLPVSMGVGAIAFVDYFGFGVATVLMFYLSRYLPKLPLQMLVQFVGVFWLNWFLMGGQEIFIGSISLPLQGLAVISLLFIWLYQYAPKKVLTGQPAKGFQYFGYAFYPVHIALLVMISKFIG